MLEALLKLQKETKLNNTEFPARLGIAYETWRRIRKEKLPISPEICRRAVRSFPQLQSAASLFLFSDDTSVSESSTIGAGEREPVEVAGR